MSAYGRISERLPKRLHAYRPIRSSRWRWETYRRIGVSASLGRACRRMGVSASVCRNAYMPIGRFALHSWRCEKRSVIMAFLWRFLFGHHVTDPVKACGHSPATSEDPHSASYREDLVKPAKRLGWVPSNAVFSGHESLVVAAVKDRVRGRVRGRFERDPSFLAIVPKIVLVLVLELVLDSYWLIFALMGRPASRIAARGRSLALGIAF